MSTDAASYNQKVIILRLNLALALVEGLFVFWSFLREPSESQSAVLLGFSPLRLVLLFIVLLLWLAVCLLFIRALRMPWWGQGVGRLIWKAMEQRSTFWGLLFWAVLMYIPLFLPEGQLGFLAPYRERLSPILVWSAVISIQMMVSFIYLRSLGFDSFQNFRDVLLLSFVALIVLGLLIAFVALTRIGLTPDPIYWQEAGVPILFYQVLIAWGCCILLFFIFRRRITGQPRMETWIALALWVLASILWLSQPARPTFTSLEPGRPNFQSYPFGDSLRYDSLAHGYLLGQPIPSDFKAKPLYTFFLAILHLFAGENYDLVLTIQILVAAIIPVIVYLLTSQLGGRWAGILAALLIIVRERNHIALSNIIQTAHLKSLLSDLMAMGLMALLIWLVLRWLENPPQRRGAPFVAGGVLGLLVLLRGHPLLVLPFLLMAVVVVLGKRASLWREEIPLMFLGLFLVLAPWLWRNYQTLGEWTLQDVNSLYTVHMERIYNLFPTTDLNTAPPPLPGESSDAYYDRLRRNVSEYAIEHPERVIQFVSAHYFHNMLYSFVYLPHSLDINTLRDYAKTMPFWNHWRGELPPETWGPVAFNLMILSLGIGYAWKHGGARIFAPLLIGLGYNLSVAVGRLSGWRFILPADWITLIFYSIGLMQFFFIIQSILSRRIQADASKEQDQLPKTSRPLPIPQLIGFGVVFLVVSLALTDGHKLLAGLYSVKSAQQLVQEYQAATDSMLADPSNPNLEDFLQTDGAVVIQGQGLYPLFFKAETGIPSYSWPSYRKKPYSRLHFYLVGAKSAGVILPMKAPPAAFPDAANVIVVGCSTENGVIDALAVLVQSEPPILYTRQPRSKILCPISETD